MNSVFDEMAFCRHHTEKDLPTALAWSIYPPASDGSPRQPPPQPSKFLRKNRIRFVLTASNDVRLGCPQPSPQLANKAALAKSPRARARFTDRDHGSGFTADSRSPVEQRRVTDSAYGDDLTRSRRVNLASELTARSTSASNRIWSQAKQPRKPRSKKKPESL